jgi:ribosome assembly protein 4
MVADAKKRYDAVVQNGGERLISGSDDFTLFLWAPESSKHSVGKAFY